MLSHFRTTFQSRYATPSPLARSFPSLPERCPYCGQDMVLRHRYPGPADHIWACGNRQCSFEVRDYDTHCHDALQLLSDRLLRMEAQQAWLLVQVEELFARVEALNARGEIESALRGEGHV